MSDTNLLFGGGETAIGAEYASHIRATAAEILRDFPERLINDTNPTVAARAASMREHAALLLRSLEGVAPPPPVDGRSHAQQVHDQRHAIAPLPASELATLSAPGGFDGDPARVTAVRNFVANLGGNPAMARALFHDLLRGGSKSDPATVASQLTGGMTYEQAVTAAQRAITYAGATNTVLVSDFSTLGLGLLAAYGAHLERWSRTRPGGTS